ncbi:MAG TPA: methyltransferase, partial [Methylomirabilota bacterium]|nr:methyltransferase [Methylomirabilota bacterium]
MPIGVPGEIWIGGAGVARGYWRREELTAEKFVVKDGRRWFKSGDLARHLADGSLEFLGRADQQVKVRGFRIELGEVETVLSRHPAVRQAVAVAADTDGAGKELVAYVVRREDLEPSGDEVAEHAGEHVATWQQLYDDTYGKSVEAEDLTFNLEGWNSSYTGEPIPADEMREWVDGTVARILALAPEKVLEIGCGTGLLLFRVAPHVAAYHGTDFSAVALDLVRRQLARPETDLPHVTLAEGAADDWRAIPKGEYDVVVLNSVTQYFPSVDYLAGVLSQAIAAVRPGGSIFVGDVRSLPLLPALNASVELFGAQGTLPVADLRRRLATRAAAEEELVLAPGFFQALAARHPAVDSVEVLLKKARAENELSRFRYDV